MARSAGVRHHRITITAAHDTTDKARPVIDAELSEAIMDCEPTAAPVTIAQKRVHQASLIRAGVVCALWIATWPLRHTGGGVRLGLDVLLALGGWWAVQPGRRIGGKLFGEHGHWTSLVIALPIGFGIAAAAELWHLIRGGG